MLATADVLADDDAPASVQLTCVGCETASNSFGYSTYAGQRALVTVSGPQKSAATTDTNAAQVRNNHPIRNLFFGFCGTEEFCERFD